MGLDGRARQHRAIEQKLGVKVVKIELMPMETVKGIRHYLHDHPTDLIVPSTVGREGIARWLHGSAAEALSRASAVPTLFVPAKAQGFVDAARGEAHLRRVLIPVDHEPKPAAAISSIIELARLIRTDADERLLHVGKHVPKLFGAPNQTLQVTKAQGDVVHAVIAATTEWHADLIGMPTAGHRGFLDALRGSTTERVLRQAPCPVLAVPVG
ncbi:MAG: universal stress protein [Xanthobacteraceae bacterium]